MKTKVAAVFACAVLLTACSSPEKAAVSTLPIAETTSQIAIGIPEVSEETESATFKPAPPPKAYQSDEELAEDFVKDLITARYKADKSLIDFDVYSDNADFEEYVERTLGEVEFFLKATHEYYCLTDILEQTELDGTKYFLIHYQYDGARYWYPSAPHNGYVELSVKDGKVSSVFQQHIFDWIGGIFTNSKYYDKNDGFVLAAYPNPWESEEDIQKIKAEYTARHEYMDGQEKQAAAIAESFMKDFLNSLLTGAELDMDGYIGDKVLKEYITLVSDTDAVAERRKNLQDDFDINSPADFHIISSEADYYGGACGVSVNFYINLGEQGESIMTADVSVGDDGKVFHIILDGWFDGYGEFFRNYDFLGNG